MATTKVPLIEGCIDDDPENEDWIRQNRKLKKKPKGKMKGKVFEMGNLRDLSLQDIFDAEDDLPNGLLAGKKIPEKKPTKKKTKTEFDREDRTVLGNNEAKQRQKVRVLKYRIGIKSGGNVTIPLKYRAVPESKFADPVNYRYPIDAAHVLSARQYYNHTGQQVAGSYNDREWAILGRRVVAASGENYRLWKKQVVAKKKVAKSAFERGQGQGVGKPKQTDGGTGFCYCPVDGKRYEHKRGTPCVKTECPDHPNVMLTGIKPKMAK